MTNHPTSDATPLRPTEPAPGSPAPAGTRECPECGGAGWTVGTDTRCCGRSDYECGGRGCTGPEPEQVQEQCEYCQGSGFIDGGQHD
jgi:hypothetical protein